MSRPIFETNFLFYFVNQFHIFMLISTNLSILDFLHPSLLHSKVKTYFSVNLFHHRPLTIRTFSASALLIGFSSWFGAVD